MASERVCGFAIVMLRRLAHGERVESTGRWTVRKHFQYHLDTNLTDALVQLFQQHRNATVLDIGAGSGRYVRVLRNARINATGIDGPSAARLSRGSVRGHDLTVPLDPCVPFTWVMSLEVAEHIPREHEEIYLRTLNCSVGFGLVLSWAPKDQAGSGHVNPRERDSVIRRLASFGLLVDLPTSTLLGSAAKAPWFRDNLLVFSRAGQEQQQQLRRHAGALLPARMITWARPGYCNATSTSLASCTRQKNGAVSMHPKEGTVTGARECVQYCRRCANCRFVSFSARYNDCSWHSQCDFDHLHTGSIPGERNGSADTFLTLHVKRADTESSDMEAFQGKSF